MKKYVAALGITLTLVSAQAAQAQVVTAPPVPAKLEVEVGNEPFLIGRGVGTQNYECQPVDSVGRVNWVLFTPQATLFDDRNEQLTTHFFSPNPLENGIVRASWQDSRDTSSVWGAVVESSTDVDFVKADAIAWLLLDVINTGAQAGPTGGESLSKTTFIQRVNTEGGLAPSTGCARPTDVGKRRFVPYQADYVFFRRSAR
jgi:hypothetical protein